MTPVEHAALELLTRGDGETFERHTLRIGDAEGWAGAIARSVKLADLEDHKEKEVTELQPAWAANHLTDEMSAPLSARRTWDLTSAAEATRRPVYRQPLVVPNVRRP